MSLRIRHLYKTWLACITIIVIILQNGQAMTEQYPQRIKAPEFPKGMEWLNTDKPLQLSDLKGKMVLLDFWTYCCINCMHIIPTLKALEDKYANELVVIGVHSAKFENERDSDNIRQAILRYEIRHPVVNDNELKIWQYYGVRAWPTLVLNDPQGYLLGIREGEISFHSLDQVIGQFIKEFKAKGLVNETYMRFVLEKEKMTATPLSFPGKILADKATKRLFIADSNHNRIVITDLEGKVMDVAGNGSIGKDDGSFDSASFNHLQGMALDGEFLYVADTENHLVRLLNLKNRSVKTIAGTGEQAIQFNEKGKGRSVVLNSPWDLELVDGKLYIAMAGSHQIWMMDLSNSEIRPYAGSGSEDIIDGSLLQAAMAQPSGLTTDGKVLYVADSEVSGIRIVDLNPTGSLRTIVGRGLFEFGDLDGKGEEVRLQHPLGVSYYKGKVYVADTYNHRIKIIDPELRIAQSYLGDGSPGLKDGRGKLAKFYEPGGISIANGKLYIADTNNHNIRVANLKTAQVSTLHIKGLAIPSAVAGFDAAKWIDTEIINLPTQTIKPAAQGQLSIDLKMPKGYHLNPLAPLSYQIEVEGDGIAIASVHKKLVKNAPDLPIIVPFTTLKGLHTGEIKVDLTFYYCKEDNRGICLIQSLKWHVSVEVRDKGGTQRIALSYHAKLSPSLQKSLGK